MFRLTCKPCCCWRCIRWRCCPAFRMGRSGRAKGAANLPQERRKGRVRERIEKKLDELTEEQMKYILLILDNMTE